MSYETAASVIAHLIEQPVRMLIDGQLQAGRAKEGALSVGDDTVTSVINPATGTPCATAPLASSEQLSEAVAAAKRAQKAWGATPLSERRNALLIAADRLETHVDQLAGLLTLEQGRHLPQTRGEVIRAASLLRALLSINIEDDVLREDATGKVYVQHRPLGVIGAIAPWNVPIGLAVPKIAHALYMGNTIVLKPSPFTPLATLRLGELLADLFPRGVLNIVNGGNDIGEALCVHPDVAKIALTGSVATGKRVMAACAGTLKRLTLELGGNDPCIVRHDAQVSVIAPQLFAAAFINCGQVCMAIKRLFVHRSIHDALVQRLAELASAARLGDGFDPESNFGPLQNIQQFNAVKAVLDEVQGDGNAKILAGGNFCDRPGYFIQPTIVTGLREGSTLVDQETFGPILPVMSFDSDQEAIERANTGALGLCASVWGTDINAAEAVARCLEVGTVWINRHVGVDPFIPFGGAKESGLGRQFGRQGLLDFTETTAIYVPRPNPL